MNALSLRLAFGILLAVSAAGPVRAGYSAASDPSPPQIYLVAARNLTEAQQMVQDVLKHHPESAVGHWVAAVLDARAANLLVASQELARAQQLAPGLPFISPVAVADLQRQLAKAAGASPPDEAHVASANAGTH